MVAAGGRLFVVTEQGRIYCFGGKKVETNTYALEHRVAPSSKDEWTRAAGDILDATGVTAGYCLVWGLKQGRLVEELVNRRIIKGHHRLTWTNNTSGIYLVLLETGSMRVVKKIVCVP